MSKVQTNFRAEDMVPSNGESPFAPNPGTGGEPASDGSESGDNANTQPTEEGSEAGNDENSQPVELQVPDGTVADVLAWVGDDPERAQLAADAENAKSKPRVSLLEKLDEVMQGS